MMSKKLKRIWKLILNKLKQFIKKAWQLQRDRWLDYDWNNQEYKEVEIDPNGGIWRKNNK